MTHIKILLLTLILATQTNIAFAHGDDEHHSSSDSNTEAHGDHHGATHSAKGKETHVEGKLVGMTCFVKHGATGENHRKCAQECAEKGLPLGILTDGGKLYQVSGEGHASLKETNTKLLKYAEKNIIAIGETFEKNGMNMIVVSKVKEK